MRDWTTGFTAVLMLLAAGPTAAGPLTDAAVKAEQLATAGDAAGARAAMRAALGDFSATLPLGIGRAVFVSAEPTGFAMYDPRPTSSFRIGEPIVSYIEPVGLTWKPATVPEKVQTHFTVDFDILATDGKILASQKAFGDFTFTGFVRNQEIYSTLTVDVSGAPVGDYVLRFHFNDLNSGRKASVDQPFVIVAQSP